MSKTIPGGFTRNTAGEPQNANGEPLPDVNAADFEHYGLPVPTMFAEPVAEAKALLGSEADAPVGPFTLSEPNGNWYAILDGNGKEVDKVNGREGAMKALASLTAETADGTAV